MAASSTSADPGNADTANQVEYQGQFGPFTITPDDRQEVRLYRAGLAGSALCFAIAVGLLQWPRPWTATAITLLYGGFWLGLGISLWKIHIYLKPLHLALQGFWLVGGLTSLGFGLLLADPLALAVVNQPALLWGIGFSFAALTGIFFKEAFCFDRLETKLLTPLVPLVLLGHLTGTLPRDWAVPLLQLWAGLYLVFALRKLCQAIDPDIGDKSVFDELARRRQGV